MKFGLERMNEITEKIYKRELPYVDNVIIGDNSSGKTLLLKLFIDLEDNGDSIYFIDAVNRSFDVKKISRTEKKPEYRKTILETRLQETYFNLADSFNCFGTSTERIEMIYWLYEEEVQNLFYEITNERFKIIDSDPLGEVDFQSGRGLLSSGYQALIRIFLELLYYQDMEIKKRHRSYAWIVIDELDEFLSPRYSALILEFLKKKFPWGRWIVTTHSCDLVANTCDANLIILDDCNCEVIDLNDYSSVSEVQIVFERLFRTEGNVESSMDNMLRRLLNNKINQAWGQQDEECLKEINSMKLTASQQIIVNQIRKW